MDNSTYSSLISTLDDDSSLNIFYLYWLFVLGEDQDEEYSLFGGNDKWYLEHWWYKLAQVCKKWRNLIFGSSFYLKVCLVCSKGTPVVDMLMHSPLL